MSNKYKAGTAVIFLRLPGELKNRLLALARSKSRSASELAREAIQQYLARHKMPKE